MAQPPLGLDIRDVAYKNTALYSRTFHERGTCDGSSDLVLWRAGHTPESIVFHLLWYSCSVLYPLSCTDIYCYLCSILSISDSGAMKNNPLEGVGHLLCDRWSHMEVPL